MTTYYLKDHKQRRIRKVDGSKVTVYRTLKPLAWFLLGAASMLAIIGLAFYMAKRSERWYQECDDYYGYTTNYYTCRLYHIRGGK